MDECIVISLNPAGDTWLAFDVNIDSGTVATGGTMEV